jgi:hypothetical protein
MKLSLKRINDIFETILDGVIGLSIERIPGLKRERTFRGLGHPFHSLPAFSQRNQIFLIDFPSLNFATSLLLTPMDSR